MKWLLLRPAQVLRVGAVACALAAAPSVARADQLDRVLVNDSADVAAKVAALGVGGKAIAVLPFQVKIGSQPATFKQGLEGTQLANKLQNLLVLTNPAGEAGKEYTVLGDAAKAAAAAGKAKGKALDWTTAEGRKALLALQLPVVWDDSKKKAPDTFLTGELTLTPDLKGATVKLMSFSAKDGGASLKRLCDLNETASGGKIRVDRNMLADLGKSFAVSKVVLTKPRPKTVAGRTKAVTEPDETAADSAGTGPAATPAGSGATTFADCPVELTVMADDKPIGILADGSSNFRLNQTPPEGSRLRFDMTNKGDKPVAVLLVVDGQNLIQMPDAPDQAATGNSDREKWRKFVLEPNKLYTVKSWRKSLDGKSDKELKVDTEASSASRFDAMSADTAGKIEMLVYPANSEGSVPVLTGGTGTGGGSEGGGSGSTDTDMPSQVDAATDASPMESMDKSIGKTKSAAAAQTFMLKKLPGFAVAKSAKKSIQLKPPAHTGKLMGKTKGLLIADGGGTFDAGETTEEKFVHAALPTAKVSITYYTPQMAAPQPAAGN